MPGLLPYLFLALALPALAAAQEPPSFVGQADCRIARIGLAPENSEIKWSGKCKDGYADGPGNLTWNSTQSNWRLEGALARGEVVGEATLTFNEGSYAGHFKQGVPHGLGFFQFSSGPIAMYEGEVVAGQRQGYGIAVYTDRSRYEGLWQDGRRHGKGKATFTLGGSYDGEWKDDKFDGKGSIVYAGAGHRYEGQFAGGRIAGTPAPQTAPPVSYALKHKTAEVGSIIPGNRAVSSVPIRASWTALTLPQQNFLRSLYPAMEAGDEPPYPAQGTAPLFELVGKVKDQFPYSNDTLRLYILVGMDGAVKSVSTYGVSDKEFIRYLSMAAMAQKYKPALCRGQPCEMIYPIQFVFTTTEL